VSSVTQRPSQNTTRPSVIEYNYLLINNLQSGSQPAISLYVISNEVEIMERTVSRRRPSKFSQRVLLALVVVLSTAAFAQDAIVPAADSAKRAPRLVLVSVSDRKLAVLENGKVIRTFAVSVGAAVSPSPTGEFQIINRLANPTYYHPGTVIPPGNDNPIGPRWIGLSQKGFGIHGTNQPRSIGHAASHGCIRLKNRDIVQFFQMVRVGDTVSIRSERDEQIAQIFGGVADTDEAAMAETNGQ
jgi:lipoprotein-anchoring transpeptidase ErfK/SrfK